MEQENAFWKHWFKGFEKGLDGLNEAGKDALLKACGKACAESHTARIFQEEWEKHGPDMEAFLSGLEKRFFDCTFTMLEGNRVRATYGRCFCDLVTEGYVKTLALCGCSVHNLKENFRAALGREVEVEVVSTVLGGDERCEFIVTL